MTTTRWVVLAVVLVVVLLILTNDHLRCTLTFGEWGRPWFGEPETCLY